MLFPRGQAPLYILSEVIMTLFLTCRGADTDTRYGSDNGLKH